MHEILFKINFSQSVITQAPTEARVTLYKCIKKMMRDYQLSNRKCIYDDDDDDDVHGLPLFIIRDTK